METSVCRKCYERKPLTEFSPHKRTKLKVHPYCRSCHAQYRAQYQAKRRLINRNFVDEILKSRSCIDCGITDPIVLEFDHINPAHKENTISNIIRKDSFEKLQAELSKCVVRCANCHRRRTAKQFNFHEGYR